MLRTEAALIHIVNFLKKLGYWSFYALYLLVFLGLVDYFFFYRPFIQRIRNASDFIPAGWDPYVTQLGEVNHVSRDLMKLLGAVEDLKTSMFTRFSKDKGEGVIRICCFGDSFTAGVEVSVGYDYPALLQRIIDARGTSNVEVLNFGVGGYGFHQSYMLWDFVGRGFGCDYRLLGPRGFQASRDTTFGFLPNSVPYYLHARYVLDGAGGVRLIEIPGDNYGDRFDYHFRFFQPWSVLRYSRNPPIFLKALIPRNRTLGNPFYYDRRSMIEEANETYGILLSRMAEEPSQMVLGAHRQEIVDLGTAVEAAHVSSALFHEPETFPYLARDTHASPQGNLLLARQFLAQLTGDREPLTLLETSDLDWSSRPSETRPKRALTAYSRIDVELAGVLLGEFVVNGPRRSVLKGVDGLLVLKAPTETVLDGCFAPVELELQPGMKVVLKVETERGSREYPVGDVIPVGGGINIGLVEAKGFEFMVYQEIKHLRDAGVITPLTHGKRHLRGLFFHGYDGLDVEALPRQGTRLTVLVGGTPILEGERSQLDAFRGFWMKPIGNGPCRQIKGRQDGLVDPKELEETGWLELVTEHWEDGVVRVPIAAWKKSVLEGPRIEKPVARRLTFAPKGHAALSNLP